MPYGRLLPLSPPFRGPGTPRQALAALRPQEQHPPAAVVVDGLMAATADAAAAQADMIRLRDARLQAATIDLPQAHLAEGRWLDIQMLRPGKQLTPRVVAAFFRYPPARCNNLERCHASLLAPSCPQTLPPMHLCSDAGEDKPSVFRSSLEKEGAAGNLRNCALFPPATYGELTQLLQPGAPSLQGSPNLERFLQV